MSASFPNAVKTFTTKNPGDVIQSADVDDLQDEVHAIEDGYLNGTAGLNSSNSTLANLSVTGNSTIAGSLAVAGTLTIGGQQVLTPTGCRLTHSVDQGLSSGSWVGLNWDTETYDPANLHSTSANSSRITFAGSTGLYTVGASVQWSTAVNANFAIRVMLNDGIGQCLNQMSGAAPVAFSALAVAGSVRASSTTDYVTVQIYQNGYSSASVMGTGTAGSTLAGCWFWAAKVG